MNNFLILLLITFHTAVSPSSFDKLDFIELLTTEGALKSFYNNCRNHVNINEDIDCNIIDYLVEVQSLYGKLNRKADKIIARENEIKYSTESFQKLFQDYITQDKPFKGTYVSTIFLNSSQQMNDKLHENDDGNLQNDSDVVIPSISFNSYFPRMKQRLQNDEIQGSNYINKWPVEIKLLPNVPTIVEKCPANLHMILFNPRKTENNLIKIRLFDDIFSSEFGPFYHKDINVSLPHNFFYSFPGFEDMNENVVTALPPFSEIQLHEDEYLFIPRSFLMSILNSHTTLHSTIYQLCLLDASNIHHFRESIALESKILPHAKAILDTLNSPLFDTSMNREPKDLPLSVFNTYPRDSLSSLLTAKNTTAEGGTAPIKLKRGRGGSAFKDWQELNKWNLFIHSLTMPQPPCPTVIHVDRNTVSLKWTSGYLNDIISTLIESSRVAHHPSSRSIFDYFTPFPSVITVTSPMTPKALDETRFGFNVTFCNTASTFSSSSSLLSDADGSSSSSSSSSRSEDETSTESDGTATINSGSSSSSSSSESIPSCLFYQFERKELREELDLLSSTHTGSEVLVFSAKVKGLQPSTSYRYRLTMFYGLAYSAPSQWSLAPVTTNPVTTPSPVTTLPTAILESIGVTSLRLVLAQPADDGGSDILGYHIYGRHTRVSYHYSEWLWMGTSAALLLLHGQGKHVVQISNLIGNTDYQFKVSPFNIIGSSSVPSPATSTITTKNTTVTSRQYTEVFGRGHPSRYSTAASGGPDPEHAHPKYHSVYSNSHLEASSTSSLLLSISDYEQKVTVLQIMAASTATATADKSIAAATTTLSDKSVSKKLLAVEGWASHWSPSLFAVTAEAVWTLPPLANTTLLNPEEVHGRIAVTHRGQIPLVFKALHAQMAGALGVVIVDDGTCLAFDQLCVPGADKDRGERFSAIDHSAPWRNIRIPVILLLQPAAKELLTTIDLSDPLTTESVSLNTENSSKTLIKDEL